VLIGPEDLGKLIPLETAEAAVDGMTDRTILKSDYVLMGCQHAARVGVL
jgi:hypothetical protein